jgi:3-phenylpropionate/trans-cinnamate dioxygenase ferredoxin subunit
MSELLLVCSTEDVPKGSAVSADIAGTQIAVVHGEDDGFYAVRDECSHASVALSEGEVEGCMLECWLHGSRFDLRTGEPTGLPATEPVPVYPVEIRDGDIYIRVDEDGRPNPSNGVTAP